MKKIWKLIKNYWVDALVLVGVGIFFIVPFAFILSIAAKSRQEAGLFQFTWPTEFLLWENLTPQQMISGNADNIIWRPGKISARHRLEL